MVVTLVDAGSDALACATARPGWATSSIDHPDLVAHIGRVLAAGLPPTAPVRVQQGRLLVPLSDQDAMIGRLSRPGTGDLPGIRRRLVPTGRWACQRCGWQWYDPRHPGRRWYALVDDDGPHVCPRCFSYSLTHAI